MRILHHLTLMIFYKIFMKNFLRFFVGVEFHKTHLLAQHKQVFIAGNHNSHIDTMAIMCSLPWQRLIDTHPVAAKDYFGKNPLIKFLSVLFINVKFIDRHDMGGADEVLSPIIRELKKGQSMILFPEGSRGEPEVMKEFKYGITKLVRKFPEIPIVPCFMKNFGIALPKGESLVLPVNSRIVFGESYVSGKNLNPTEILEDLRARILCLSDIRSEKLSDEPLQQPASILPIPKAHREISLTAVLTTAKDSYAEERSITPVTDRSIPESSSLDDLREIA